MRNVVLNGIKNGWEHPHNVESEDDSRGYSQFMNACKGGYLFLAEYVCRLCTLPTVFALQVDRIILDVRVDPSLCQDRGKLMLTSRPGQIRQILVTMNSYENSDDVNDLTLEGLVEKVVDFKKYPDNIALLIPDQLKKRE